MCDERWAPAASILPGQKRAIIAGGYSYAKRHCVSSISLFDSPTGRFSLSHARLPYPADFVTATALQDGSVLLAGGFNDVWGSLDSAALYHPQNDTCIQLPCRMRERRELAQATQLSDGSVLITGGLNLDARTTLAGAEIYEPATRLFRSTAGPMHGDRFGHAACRLEDGRVLIVGGTHWNLRLKDSQVLSTAELYDPATDRFDPCAGELIAARDRPTATLLPNGEVLVAGGQGIGGAAITFAELFDPNTERFTRIEAPPLEPRMAHSAASLTTGDVLLCGGWNASEHSTTSSCVLYEWKARQFIQSPSLTFATHDLVVLGFSDGKILAAGGKSARGATSSSNSQGAMLHFP